MINHNGSKHYYEVAETERFGVMDAEASFDEDAIAYGICVTIQGNKLYFDSTVTLKEFIGQLQELVRELKAEGR